MKNKIISLSFIRRIPIYIFLGVAGYILGGSYPFESLSISLAGLLYGSILSAVLWEGNGAISEFLTRRISWIEFPFRRMMIGVMSMLLFTLLASFLLSFIYFVFVLRMDQAEFLSFTLINLFVTLLITLIITLILHARDFFHEWRKSLYREERLKQEKLSAQVALLKQQLNPHFLFNSLNVLSTLVYKNPDQASRFIKSLSDVYRYILEHTDKNLVDLQAELICLESYIYLLQIRFAESLQIHLLVTPSEGRCIAPMTLQMLVENAVKHNVLSKDKPLRIDIADVNDHIVVSNTLQEKEVGEHALGMGLKNIQERYRLLSNKTVQISQTAALFSVSIPNLYYEGLDH